MGNDYHANLTGSDLHIVKVHAINSTAAHTGTPAAVAGDAVVFDANGLPADSGMGISATAGTTMTFPSTSKTIMASDFSNAAAGALANGTTATTQSAGDNSTKVATTAYVDRGAGALANGTTATTQSAGDNSTKVATTAYCGMTLFNTSPFSGVSSVLISNIPSTVGLRYHVVIDMKMGTATVIPYLCFNDDTGGNYWWSIMGWNSSGAFGQEAESVGNIQLSQNNMTTDGAMCSFDMTINAGNSANVSLVGTTQNFLSGHHIQVQSIAGYWGNNGSSTMSMRLLTTAGVITGTISIYRYN